MSTLLSQSNSEARQIRVELQLLKNEMRKQLQQRLYHLVEAHENDRKDILARFLTKASLTYSGSFEKLRGDIEHDFECYVALIRYSQGNSSGLSFTNKAPPPPWDNTEFDFARMFSTKKPEASHQEAASSKEVVPYGNDSTLSTEPSTEFSDSPSTNLSLPPISRRARGQEQRHQRVVDKRPLVRKKKIPAPRSTVMKTSVATRACQQNPSMAFCYDLGGGSEYYILHCPNVSSGCKFSFSSHPFVTGLASQHFKECGIAFQDDTDIVRRFAYRLERQMGHEKKVSSEWVAKYNRRVESLATLQTMED
ncbi:hypothetical protein BDP55DRAFT_635612 [Colletotrichum godetiae]|uniref:Uncharacterized protein n=1 Tax=Colletotrichum godetiae TaxID=1209918 RepID=A0AAJ0AD71_9PEZI|nr:uncharacterized protein BDP55DRAFT_635612 [Colletotrichum godetiae]KAK1671756.1 hypothetical protein BDP55DRAFT_635612 [Colletotrichum godetiae]